MTTNTAGEVLDLNKLELCAKKGAHISREDFLALIALARAGIAAPAEVLAWAHEDGRVVAASTMESARRDGGAMRSSLSGYTIPLGRIAAPTGQQAEPVAVDAEALRDAVTNGLRGLWGCGRVWSAWNVGTMGEEDFYAADESDECIDQVIDALAPILAAPTAAVEPSEQPLIGKLLDQFSELPVLWGLNEPGALVRHSDVFRMLVDAGKAQKAAQKQGASVLDAWISVEDERKPKGRTPILVTVDYVRYGEYEDGTPGEWRSQIVTEGEYVPQHGEAGDYFTSYSSPHGDADVVTHWMPLPIAAQPKDTMDTTKGQA